MIDRDGGEATRKQLGVARHTMERAALGGTIQRGTVALLTKALAVLCLVLAGCMEGTGNAPAVPDAGSLAAPTAQDAQVQQTTPDGAPIASQAPDARSTPDVTPDALPPDSYVAPAPPDAGVADVLAAIPDARVPDVLVLGPPDATPYVHIVGIQPGNCGYVTVVPRADRLGWTVMNTSLVDHTAFADAGWPLTGLTLGPSATVNWTTGPDPVLSSTVFAECSYNTEKTECDGDKMGPGGYGSCDIFKVLIVPLPASQTELIVSIVCDIGWGLDGVLRDGTSETRILDMTHINAGCVP